MKVIVKKFLNVRVGKPSVNAPCYQYLAPGTELEVDGTVYPGDPYDGIDTWMKDAAGNFYWTGGLDLSTATAHTPTLDAGNWWLKNFRIPDAWASGLTGAGIKIALLDTGISVPHDALKLDPKLFKDVTQSPSGIQDNMGHGTHCAGIIKAVNNSTGPVGIAYDSLLYVCKITHDDLGDKDEFLIEGIKWAISNNVDFISISNGDPVEDKNLESAIRDASAKGILVVAAAGNRIPGFPDDHIYYPARYPLTLSVGGIDENNSPLEDSLLTHETDIFAPGKEIFSTYRNNTFASLSGSSQAAPYIAGVCALLLEFQRKKEPGCPAIKIKDLLLQHADNSGFGKIVNINNLLI